MVAVLLNFCPFHFRNGRVTSVSLLNPPFGGGRSVTATWIRRTIRKISLWNFQQTSDPTSLYVTAATPLRAASTYLCNGRVVACSSCSPAPVVRACIDHLTLFVYCLCTLLVNVTALYCARCEVPRGAFLFSAKPKSSSYFGWLFILNILLDVNDGPGQAALYHQRN